MKHDIKIKTNERSIHKLFGYVNEADYMTDLSAQNNYGKRLRYLSYIFLELIDKNPQRMFMSYMLSTIISGLAKTKLDNPAKVLKYINENMDNEWLEGVFVGCGRASVLMLGKTGESMGSIIKRLKEQGYGKESK